MAINILIAITFVSLFFYRKICIYKISHCSVGHLSVISTDFKYGRKIKS